MTDVRRMPQLVIFDCAGVLLDSELIENVEMASAFTSLGSNSTATWPWDTS